MNSFRYSERLDMIVDEETGYHLSREATERLLDRWNRHHDELLRSGKPGDRLLARRVRSCWLDLEICRPSSWIAARPYLVSSRDHAPNISIASADAPRGRTNDGVSA